VLIAAGDLNAAGRAARAAGLDPAIVLTKADCAGPLRGVRRRAAQLGIRTALIHSSDWSRQTAPHLFELAAARLGLRTYLAVGSEPGGFVRRGRFELAVRGGALPFSLARALALTAAEGARLAHAAKRDRPDRPLPRVAEPTSVLAIWLDLVGAGQVGGAVTHLGGVLGGFRKAGVHVMLLASHEPAPQIASSIDEFVRLPSPSRHARTTAGVAQLAINRLARDAGARLAHSRRPSFIYQRHQALGTCGVEVAHQLGVPAVLEWNGSEAWVHEHWNRSHRLGRVITHMIRAGERYVATRADVLAAVSSHAAEMALEAGAPGARVIVVPNAVDYPAIQSWASQVTSDRSAPQVGWVGSYGPWHGAEVLVRAIRLLPEEVRALMIGEGQRRPVCERLARELGVWERIEWAGALPHAETVSRLSRCSVLVSPHVPLEKTPFFGSPTKIFEYMAIGRPIVASALAQLGEVLEDRVTALLVPPGDPSALAHAIRKLLGDHKLASALGAAARARARESHTWEERARTILRHLAG
jgi:glycosyltransferase involved in cell wall biosynthesis